MPGSVKTVEIILTANAKQAAAEIEALAGKVDASSGSMGSKFAAFGGKVAIATGVAAAAVGAMSVKIADEFETANARLQVAVKNTGGSFTAIQPQLVRVDVRGSSHQEPASDIWRR